MESDTLISIPGNNMVEVIFVNPHLFQPAASNLWVSVEEMGDGTSECRVLSP